MDTPEPGEADGAVAAPQGGTVLLLICECMRRPWHLPAIGAAGVTDRRMRRQLYGAFLVLSLLQGLACALIARAPAQRPLLAMAVTLTTMVALLLMTTLAMWVLATFFRPTAKFGELLSGLTLCQVFGALAFLAGSIVVELLVRVDLCAPMPALLVLWLLSLLLMALLIIYFITGAFDMGYRAAVGAFAVLVFILFVLVRVGSLFL